MLISRVCSTEREASCIILAFLLDGHEDSVQSSVLLSTATTNIENLISCLSMYGGAFFRKCHGGWRECIEALK